MHGSILASGNYSRFQSTHRASYSTETAFLKVVNNIWTTASEGRFTAVLVLDISAAVNYQVLCQ